MAKWSSPWHDCAEEHKQVFPQQKQLYTSRLLKLVFKSFLLFPIFIETPTNSENLIAMKTENCLKITSFK